VYQIDVLEALKHAYSLPRHHTEYCWIQTALAKAVWRKL
jgi:hypothetical protein